MDIVEPKQEESSRARQLKAATHATYDWLDRSIMEAASFATMEGYRRFAEIQYHLHRAVAPLYADARLLALLPGLKGRQRLDLIVADLRDVGGNMIAAVDVPGPSADVATGLDWLYVVEGSNMGAALLRKAAAKIGLSDNHGACHLAPAGEGPAAHWRAFTAALDAVVLTSQEEVGVIAGANAAFAHVQALVDAGLSDDDLPAAL
jgi:heme oxygenase